MSISVQNLRAIGTGVEPTSLLPSQLAFNLTDKVIYVGDGSNFKTPFGETPTPGVPNKGWYSMPMDLSVLGDYYITNPEYYGDIPSDKNVLTWNSSANRPVWANVGGIVYLTTDAAVTAAPGITITEKINAVNVDAPLEGDTTIVVGTPGQTYEGLYFYDSPTAQWVFGAHYAYPLANDVPYDNTASGLTSDNVQGAIDEVETIASDALPKSGGTMTGDIVFNNGQLVDAGTY